MRQKEYADEAMVLGRINVYRVHFQKQDRHHPRKIEHLFGKPNQLQHGWGYAAAQCLGKGNRSYKIAAMYIEFENTASSGDPVTAPTYDRAEGVEYYQDLELSVDRDFLRVPLLVEPEIGIETGYEDSFTAGESGNKLTFFTQTQGTTGFHGKTFSDSVNSTIFGVALVATPEFSDPTKDVVAARTYFEVADQVVKLPNSQVGVTWDWAFK